MNTNIFKNKTFLAVILSAVFLLIALFSAEGFDWKNLKYSGNAITTDELVHITGGYYYFQTHRYLINPGEVPLVKDIAALPLLILHPVFPEISSTADLSPGYAWSPSLPQKLIFSSNLERQDDSWDLGRIFLFSPQNDPDLIVFWSRLSVIFFNSLFLFILYLSVSKIWNKRSAIFGLFLLAFSPLSLAHGSVVNMDFMSSVLQMVTLAFFAAFLKGNKRRYFFLTAFFLALAILAKLSSLILLPVLFLGGLVYVQFLKRSFKKTAQHIFHLSGIFFLALLLITLVYAFQSWNTQTADIFYQMSTRFPAGVYHWIANHLPNALFNNPLAKGLAEFFVGIFMLSTRLAQAQQKIYFLGHVYGSQGAGLTYFSVLFMTKLSVGLLLLFFAGLFAWLYGRIKKLPLRQFSEDFKKFLSAPFAFLLIVFSGLYAVPALNSKLQLGIRYILPIIFALTLLTARFLDNYWNIRVFKNLQLKYFFFSAMSAAVLATLFSFPYYISYYNILGGGTANGYNIATDSNYDWGTQDMTKMAYWIRQNNIKNIYVDIPSSSYPLQYYLGSDYYSYDINTQPLPPSGSLVAMSVTEYQFDRDNNQLKILENKLVARLGTTILVFRV